MDVSVGQIPEILKFCRKSGEIPMFTGIPGCGKTESIRQEDSEYRASTGNPRGYFYHEMRGSTMDATDLTGCPFPVNGRTTFLKPDILPEEGMQGTLVIDEFGQMPVPVMNAVGKILDGVGFPRSIFIVCATNRACDGAAVNKLPSHIRNRIIIYNVLFSVDDWVNYNLAVGTHPAICAFAKFRPELFPLTPPKDNGAFMTGRSLTKCSKVLQAGLKAPLDLATYSGLIGDGSGIELTGFLRVYQSLVLPQVILMDPENAPIPQEKSASIATAMSLAFISNSGNFEKICQYALRLPAEESILLIVTCNQKNNAELKLNPRAPKLGAAACPSFLKWADKYQGVL